MVREGRILWDNPSFCRSELDQLRRLDRGDDNFAKPLRKTPSATIRARGARHGGRPDPQPSQERDAAAGKAKRSPIAPSTGRKQRDRKSES